MNGVESRGEESDWPSRPLMASCNFLDWLGILKSVGQDPIKDYVYKNKLRNLAYKLLQIQTQTN